MKQVIVLFALVAAAVAQTNYTYGFRVRFGLDDGAFREIPRTVLRADEMGWTQMERPPGPYPELFMYCPPERIACALFDESLFIAGFQIALPKDEFTPTYNMTAQGYIDWDIGGKSYWTTTQYLVSEVTLGKSVAQRKADISETINPPTLREDAVWVNNINGDGLLRIPVNKADIGAATGFVELTCNPSMGDHWYYEMGPGYECVDETLHYFPMTDSTQLTSMGFMGYGRLSDVNNSTAWFESPISAFFLIVNPNSPECWYGQADTNGITAMHIYYVDPPSQIVCD